MCAEWVTFPGGELEGRRPRALCPTCRERLQRVASRSGAIERPRALCFQCYRAELDRQKALASAARIDTASNERFQFLLPFEPVNRPRLEMLKAERAVTPSWRLTGASPGRLVEIAERRRHAQIAARHALQSPPAGLHMQKATQTLDRVERERFVMAAIHAAELQLPESWLPFVVSR